MGLSGLAVAPAPCAMHDATATAASSVVGLAPAGFWFQGGGGDFSAAEIATSDAVYEVARGQRMRKKQVS